MSVQDNKNSRTTDKAKVEESVVAQEVNVTSADAASSQTAEPTNNPFLRFGRWFMSVWTRFKTNHKTLAQFLVFFIISNGVTVLQLALMPLFKVLFNMTPLVDINFQFGQIGTKVDGSQYFMFDYGSGNLDVGGGGGLAYFLAMQITLLIAQVINFFAQRNVTFKGKNNIWWAAMWYAIAYVVITLIVAALQGLYKAPIYNQFINVWDMGKFGETLADFITMVINAAISFWVFFPIFKVIFKDKGAKQGTATNV